MSGGMVGTALLGILLMTGLIGVSSWALYVSVTNGQYDQIQDARLANLSSKEALDVIALRAADTTNLLLLESELLLVLNTVTTINTTLQSEIVMILTEMALINVTGNTTLLFNLLTNETAARIAKDMILMGNVSMLGSEISDLNTTINNLNISLTALEAVDGTLKEIDTGVGLGGGPIFVNGTIFLANTTVTPGPYFWANFIVDQQGRLTDASSNPTPVTSLTSVGFGLVINGTSGDLMVNDTGIYSINGQLSNYLTGDLSLAGANGITVYMGNSSFQVVIDGSNLTYSIGNLTAALAILQSTVTTLQSTVSSLQVTVTTLQTSVNVLQTSVNTLTTEVNSIQTNVTTLQTTVAGLGTVTNVTAGVGLGIGPGATCVNGAAITTNGTINICPTGVTAGFYTNPNITLNAEGQIVSATNGTGGGGGGGGPPTGAAGGMLRGTYPNPTQGPMSIAVAAASATSIVLTVSSPTLHVVTPFNAIQVFVVPLNDASLPIGTFFMVVNKNSFWGSSVQHPNFSVIGTTEPYSSLSNAFMWTWCFSTDQSSSQLGWTCMNGYNIQ